MHQVYLSLGSNLGDRTLHLNTALHLIGERLGEVLRTSSYIETEPVGFLSDNKFLNAACLISTSYSPEECLIKTQQIERDMGRTEKSSDGIYHDRIIDIDILTYDDLHIENEQLTIPHPKMHERDFVMIPLKQILL